MRDILRGYVLALRRSVLFRRRQRDPQLQAVQIGAGEGLAVFEEGQSALRFEARGDTGFVLGTAVKHPHDLVLGYYSVHTSAQALEAGEAEIRRIGERLRASGRL